MPPKFLLNTDLKLGVNAPLEQFQFWAPHINGTKNRIWNPVLFKQEIISCCGSENQNQFSSNWGFQVTGIGTAG
jgi:hypothetical protein